VPGIGPGSDSRRPANDAGHELPDLAGSRHRNHGRRDARRTERFFFGSEAGGVLRERRLVAAGPSPRSDDTFIGAPLSEQRQSCAFGKAERRPVVPPINWVKTRRALGGRRPVRAIASAPCSRKLLADGPDCHPPMRIRRRVQPRWGERELNRRVRRFLGSSRTAKGRQRNQGDQESESSHFAAYYALVSAELSFIRIHARSGRPGSYVERIRRPRAGVGPAGRRSSESPRFNASSASSRLPACEQLELSA